MRYLSLIFLFLLFTTKTIFAFSCETPRPLIQKPILFNETRIQLTKDYLSKHYGLTSSDIRIQPKMIVLHWTAIGTLAESFNTFYSPFLANRPELPDRLNVSAHFLVDRDGTIYQLMPDNWMARHVIGLNYFAIGIENVGGVNAVPDLTEQQAESNAYLVCYLKKKYPGIQYLIGHMEYLQYQTSPLWLEKDPSYKTTKTDPGEDFMRKVKALLKGS